jgi:hypothetical protein
VAEVAAPEAIAPAEVEIPEPAQDEVPATAVDPVEEARAAMWRRRMKKKVATPDRREPAASGSEADAGPETTEDDPAAADRKPKATSLGDVDVVALAREFSSLFGDDDD